VWRELWNRHSRSSSSGITFALPLAASEQRHQHDQYHHRPAPQLETDQHTQACKLACCCQPQVHITQPLVSLPLAPEALHTGLCTVALLNNRKPFALTRGTYCCSWLATARVVLQVQPASGTCFLTTTGLSVIIHVFSCLHVCTHHGRHAPSTTGDLIHQSYLVSLNSTLLSHAGQVLGCSSL